MMRPGDAERRLERLEHRTASADPTAAAEALHERLLMMIDANVRHGAVWSCYSPQALAAELRARIAHLDARASSADPTSGGIFSAISGWLREALTAAQAEQRENRPVLDLSTRGRALQPLSAVSHMEIVSLYFGRLVGADEVAAGTRGD